MTDYKTFQLKAWIVETKHSKIQQHLNANSSKKKDSNDLINRSAANLSNSLTLKEVESCFW